MSEHLRALVVIFPLCALILHFAKVPVCLAAMTEADYKRRRLAWITITLIAFLSHNFWLYIVGAGVFLSMAKGKENNKLSLYYFVLFAVPMIPGEISGLGIMDHFFKIHYSRLLSLAILLPTWLFLRRQEGTKAFGQYGTDKFLAAYVALGLLLQFSADTFTNTLRHGFYAFVDMFLPYYVASRSLRKLSDFREALAALVVAAMILSPVAVFEFVKHWLLYSSLTNALGVAWDMGAYLPRGESLRALATLGQPIALGYVMAVAVGVYLFVIPIIGSRKNVVAGFLVLIAGLIAPLSRGPWIGAMVMVFVFVILGPNPGEWIRRFGLAMVVAVPAILVSPLGNTIIDHLPFVGTIDAENVIYRQRLLDASIQLIKQNPFFGAVDFMNSPEMQELQQGDQGMIDIVNTYVAIALTAGLIGLSLFVSFFASVILDLYRALRRIADKDDERHALGRSLLATTLGILLIIFTTSSITVIPTIYWSLAGVCLSYSRILINGDPFYSGSKDEFDKPLAQARNAMVRM